MWELAIRYAVKRSAFRDGAKEEAGSRLRMTTGYKYKKKKSVLSTVIGTARKVAGSSGRFLEIIYFLISLMFSLIYFLVDKPLINVRYP